MIVAIVDYGSGNLRSAAKAFERAIHELGMAETVAVTADANVVRGADRVVLPGVGAFADCGAGLEAVPGMVDALTEAVSVRARPFLGICVGMQLMAYRGLEHGAHTGLGWIPGEVRALTPPRPADTGLPVAPIPHMGWNELAIRAPDHPVLAGLGSNAHAYFVHSYGFICEAEADLLALTDYGGPIAAMIGRDNMVGTQFHPEKSQETGLRLIANFLNWRP